MNDVTQDSIPPLPELEIDDMSKTMSDQTTVDKAIKIIYDKRPDFFPALADRVKKNLEMPDLGDEIFQFIREHVKSQIDIPNLNIMTAIFRESRRRACLMYGLEVPTVKKQQASVAQPHLTKS